MSKKLKKEVRDQIALLVTKMPKVPLAETTIVTGMQIMTNPVYEKFRSPKVLPLKKYKIRSGGALSAVNHEKRMLSAYKLSLIHI